MGYIVFADESGIGPDSPCYSIGALIVPEGVHDRFVAAFEERRRRHGVGHELKWNRVQSSHGPINFVLEWVDLIHRSSLMFQSIVVLKKAYRAWQGGSREKEQAFYKTYTMLTKDIASRHDGDARVLIDGRCDSYGKQHEVVEKISNHMLAQLGSRSRIETVTKADSRLVPGIQMADVLTGAINAAHRAFLDREFSLSRGKRVLVDRLAEMLGWDALHYDTMPNPDFNIWHFPMTEYRAVPATREVKPQTTIRYVTPEDLGLPPPAVAGEAP